MNTINNLYKYYFQNPFIGITVCDKDGICIDVNEIQTKIVGISKDEFVGKSLESIVSEHKLSSSATMKVLQSKSEVNMSQASASGNSYEVKAFPVYNEDNEIEYVINYLLDSTALTNYQKEVKRLEKDKIKNEELIKILSAANDGSPFVFASDIMKEKSELAKKIAPTDATVLITGPSGSGKELIANIVHDHSNRMDKPFIKLNCAALPEHLLESELFGYEPGAFTGGKKEGNAGLFEAADGGTLLFDEIGEMPMSLQAKILRVLQDQEVRRIGGDKSIKVDVRIIASTNAPLLKLIEEKKFREDLYYRLNVISIYVPGLEKRKDDIPGLSVHFLVSFNEKYNLNKTIDPEVISYLQSIDFPGNVRELHNLMERIVLQSKSNVITLDEVFMIHNRHEAIDENDSDELLTHTEEQSLKTLLDRYEKKVLKQYIRHYGKTAVIAEKLGIDRSTFTRKLNKYGLEL